MENDEQKNPDFRKGVLNLADKALKIMEEYLEGNRPGTDKVQEASMVLREGVKISNRDQVDAQVKRSQDIRIINFIPKEQREQYIAMTNPEAKPFLLDRPKKTS